MRASKLAQVFGYRDFRLLWLGAFLSFTGSWVQNVAQGYFVVYNLHRNEQALAYVSFFWSLPVLLFGLWAGSMADVVDKRRALVNTQILYAMAAIYLAVATWLHWVTYWQIVAIAFLNGCIACIEMPVRQSTVSNVVPPEILPAAVPVNAMTFNVARIIGPALGAFLLQFLGVPFCYLANGISFLALVWAAMAIRANLQAPKHEPQPMWDLVTEGFKYTIRDVRLRTLFVLETLTGVFGLSYLPMLPSYAKEHLHLGDIAAKGFLGYAYAFIGVGAMTGLLLITQYSDSAQRARSIRFAMWGIGLGLLVLSQTSSHWLIYPMLALVGMCTLMQFNTTNALFQLLAPERIRGRVLSMHIWSLNGLSPFGVLLAGWVAAQSREQGYLPILGWHLHTATVGTPLAMMLGSIVTLIAALAATVPNDGLSNLEPAAR